MEENKIIEQNTITKNAEDLGLVVPKNMGDYVNNTMAKYIEQGLVVPKDYNVQNAVIGSYLIIQQDDKLKNCDKTSIASSLIDMAVLGLNASKGQCYFVPYNNKLSLQPSYFGKIMAIKRIKGVIDVRADVIYKDTEYELLVDDYGNDDIVIKGACPLDKRTFDNIIGAWCRIILDKEVWGSDSYCCIMTLEQIHKSWNQGSMKGKSPAHVNFADEMCKKTVINRCCKNFVNSAKDQDILIETINRTTSSEYEEKPTITPSEAKVIDL